jgi:hypothetical protein
MKIEKQPFGKLADGTPVGLYTPTDAKGTRNQGHELRYHHNPTDNFQVLGEIIISRRRSIFYISSRFRTGKGR